MRLREGQIQTGGRRSRQHQTNILQMLREFRLNGEVTFEHLLALDIHRFGIRGTCLKDLQCRSREYTDGIGKRQALRQGGSIQTQNQIRHQLHFRSTATFADVEDVLAQNGP